MPTESRRPIESGKDPIDMRVVKALAHPTRVRILAILRDRELASPVELSNELGIALGTVGYHVRRLETLGFIELATRTQRRGAVEHHYRARATLDLPPAAFERGRAPAAGRRGAEALETVAEAHAALAHGGFDAVATRVDRRLLTLDPRGRARLETTLAELLGTIERTEQASARRLAAAGAKATPHTCTAVALLFDVAGESD